MLLVVLYCNTGPFGGNIVPLDSNERDRKHILPPLIKIYTHTNIFNKKEAATFKKFM